MAASSPVPFSFIDIRDAILVEHDVDIEPLWDWLVKYADLPRRVTSSLDIVSSVWGLYGATEPPRAGVRESEDRRRRRGVWLVIGQCHREVVARSSGEAQFLVRYAKALSVARHGLRQLTRELDREAIAYFAELKSRLCAYRSACGRRWKRASRNINLPGPAAAKRIARWFRGADNRLAEVRDDIIGRLSSPVPVAARPRRGATERHLLKRVQLTLHEAGFRDREIAKLIVDRRSLINAIDRTKERRRVRRRNRRRQAAWAGQLETK
jgi:hypothetical protein